MNNSSHTEPVLRVGIFFDGTANNTFNSLLGQERQAQGLRVDAGSSYEGIDTNIARLHQCYPVQSVFDTNGQAVTSLYVSGIGTTTGKTDTRFPAQTYGRGSTGVLGKAEEARAQLNQCLTAFVQTLAPLTLSRLQLDIFGFSRGAAAARHFTNLINATDFAAHFALADDFSCEICFVGLFDTVAAMGGLADAGDIGDDINPGLNLYLGPDCARQVVQLNARDEHRRNFALNRIAPQWPLDIALPGVHADVGGGYPLEMQEQVYLSRWQTNLVSPSTPLKLTRAWAVAETDLVEWQREDLLDPHDPSRLLEIRSESQPAGSRQDPMQRVQAAVFMQRRVYGHLSRVYMRIMHRLACDQGVPLRALTAAEAQLPDELSAIAASLEAQVGTGIIELSADQERLLRQRYVHRSANWNPGVGSGTGVMGQAFFNSPREGGRSVFDQRMPLGEWV